MPASHAERDAAALLAADDVSADIAVEAGELHDVVKPWRGSLHELQNLTAIAALNCQKLLSISAWSHDMIDQVVESVVRRALGGRTSRSCGRTSCKA